MSARQNTLTALEEKKLLQIVEGSNVSANADHKHLSAEQAVALILDITCDKFELIKTREAAITVLGNLHILEVLAEPAWRKMGWEQANGRRLPYSPDKVSYMIRESRVNKAQNHLWKTRLVYVPAGAVTGGAAGFCLVWFVYLIMERLISWVTHGFRAANVEKFRP